MKHCCPIPYEPVKIPNNQEIFLNFVTFLKEKYGITPDKEEYDNPREFCNEINRKLIKCRIDYFYSGRLIHFTCQYICD